MSENKKYCFWDENEIQEDEKYIVVEIENVKTKQYVCETCILENEKKKIDDFLKEHPNWLDDIE